MSDSDNSELQRQLIEAQNRRAQLVEQLHQAHARIKLCNSAGIQGNDVVVSRLLEAETATKKAQRDMIELQASLGNSSVQYDQLETQLRCQVNQLLAKYHDTENIAAQFKIRDKQYIAEREAIKQQHLANESRYTKQLNELNDKIKRLEALNGGSTDPGAVWLISHSSHEETHHTTLTPRRHHSSTSTSSSSSSSSSKSSVSTGHGKHQTENTTEALLVPAVGGPPGVDGWSRSSVDYRAMEDPPDYPPPPVPDYDDAAAVNDSARRRSSADKPQVAANAVQRSLAVDTTVEVSTDRQDVPPPARNASLRSSSSSSSSSSSKSGSEASEQRRGLQTTGNDHDVAVEDTASSVAASSTLEREKKRGNSADAGTGSMMRLRRLFGSKPNVEADRTSTDADYEQSAKPAKKEPVKQKKVEKTANVPVKQSDSAADVKSDGKGWKFWGKSRDKSSKTKPAKAKVAGDDSSSSESDSSSSENESKKHTNSRLLTGCEQIVDENTNVRGDGRDQNTSPVSAVSRPAQPAASASVHTTEKKKNSKFKLRIGMKKSGVDESKTLSVTATNASAVSQNEMPDSRIAADTQQLQPQSELNEGQADNWTSVQVSQWLSKSSNLGRCATDLQSRNIDGGRLLQLGNNELKELGLSSKERDTLRKAVKDLQRAVDREHKRLQKEAATREKHAKR